MLRAVLFLIGGLAAGWLVAAWWGPGPATLPGPGAGGAAPRAASLERRVAALESALDLERAARRELAAELDALAASASAYEPAAGGDADFIRAVRPGSGAETEAPAGEGDGPRAERARELRERRAASAEERRYGRLVDAGFAPDRAEWIVRREAELRLRALEAEYEARRTGEPAGALGDPTATLRADLGDADYERYLEATGRPTSVGVRDVITGSPAEQAGLRRGDRLVSYGGQRVYDLADLNRLVVEGVPGEPVTVNVVREGQTIQLVIPRGPLGITGGGQFGRRR